MSKATLYLLSSYNREIYRKIYLRQNKPNEKRSVLSTGFRWRVAIFIQKASQTSTKPQREWDRKMKITQL